MWETIQIVKFTWKDRCVSEIWSTTGSNEFNVESWFLPYKKMYVLVTWIGCIFCITSFLWSDTFCPVLIFIPEEEEIKTTKISTVGFLQKHSTFKNFFYQNNVKLVHQKENTHTHTPPTHPPTHTPTHPHQTNKQTNKQPKTNKPTNKNKNEMDIVFKQLVKPI